MRKLALLLLIPLAGCASVSMSIKTYSDPDTHISPPAPYAFVPLDEENPLLEKEIFGMVKKKLSLLGFREAKENVKYLIGVYYSSDAFTYNKPISTMMLPQYNPGQSTTHYGQIGRTTYYGKSNTQGSWTSVPATVGGGTGVAFSRGLNIVFLTLKGGKSEIVWKGTASSTGKTEDIREIAPYLIEEILNNFPGSVSIETSRMIKPSWAEEGWTVESELQKDAVPIDAQFVE